MEHNQEYLVQVTETLYSNFVTRLEECNKTRSGFANTYDKNISWFNTLVRKRRPTIQLELIVQMAEYVGCTVIELLEYTDHETQKKI